MEKDSNKINEQDFIAATTFVGKDEIQNCNSCNEGQPCDWIMMKNDMKRLGCEFFNEFVTVSDIKDEKEKHEQGKKSARHKLYKYYNAEYGCNHSESEKLPSCIEIQIKTMFPGKRHVGYISTKYCQRMKNLKTL